MCHLAYQSCNTRAFRGYSRPNSSGVSELGRWEGSRVHIRQDCWWQAKEAHYGYWAKGRLTHWIWRNLRNCGNLETFRASLLEQSVCSADDSPSLPNTLLLGELWTALISWGSLIVKSAWPMRPICAHAPFLGLGDYLASQNLQCWKWARPMWRGPCDEEGVLEGGEASGPLRAFLTGVLQVFPFLSTLFSRASFASTKYSLCSAH